MKRILFQGDSITDVGRSRENDIDGGRGYATLVRGDMGYERPSEFEFINRGISGNRVIDLLSRIKKDIINLKPDYMSILIGVNDVWHEVTQQNGVDDEEFELYYNLLIKQVKRALPDIKIMILEPFLLKGPAAEEKWDEIRKGVENKARIARKVAQENNLLFVPLMEKFDNLAKNIEPTYWLVDGVHPSAAGHEFIKREWLEAFKKLEK